MNCPSCGVEFSDVYKYRLVTSFGCTSPMEKCNCHTVMISNGDNVLTYIKTTYPNHNGAFIFDQGWFSIYSYLDAVCIYESEFEDVFIINDSDSLKKTFDNFASYFNKVLKNIKELG